jgi:hypothetical protein
MVNILSFSPYGFSPAPSCEKISLSEMSKLEFQFCVESSLDPNSQIESTLEAKFLQTILLKWKISQIVST